MASAGIAAAGPRASPEAVERPLFRLESVCFRYPESPLAISDIELTIHRGEQIALLGANSSGKSTLLRVLDGLLHPLSGTLYFQGEPLTERALADPRVCRDFRRSVSYVFQNADAQLFNQTVRDELAFGPLQTGFSPAEIERRVSDAAGLLEIEHLLDRSPQRLSAGEQRRVALGAALTLNPDALLLDEPTSGLDPRSRTRLVDLIRLLCASGKTLITATQDLDMVPAIASRAVVLGEEHRILYDGPALQLLEDTRLLKTANLVHEHYHRHGELFHSHPHHHAGEHEHRHDGPR